jgi:membrane associated rhomboid family serine protease
LQDVSADELDGSEELELPVWARNEAFPLAGEGYGWIDRKGSTHSSSSKEELSKTIREDRDALVNLVWTPESKYCRVPEEIEAFAEPISEVRKRWAADDLANAQYRLKWLGGAVFAVLGFTAFQGSSRSGWENVLKSLVSSTSVGIALLVFLVFAFIPWYQAQKRMREIGMLGGRPAPMIPMIRFETWIETQRAPVTLAILWIISLVFVFQVYFDRSILGFHGSIEKAGLVKDIYRGGDYLRVLTAPMLHGGIVHFVMNGLALLYLGKRVEVFARWPHVPMVFLFSAVAGGEASARFLNATSVGASGGLMGWLGFLLVFETLHAKLVPRSSRRRLLGGVAMTALIGLVGYKFIDNAAHFGGLLAGMAYAGIVFPKSGSVMRPKINQKDRIIGMVCLAAIAGSAILAILRMAA